MESAQAEANGKTHNRPIPLDVRVEIHSVGSIGRFEFMLINLNNKIPFFEKIQTL